jgi:hypothetical protein
MVQIALQFNTSQALDSKTHGEPSATAIRIARTDHVGLPKAQHVTNDAVIIQEHFARLMRLDLAATGCEYGRFLVG